MGNTISRDEHNHEIDELREEQRKQQEETERRHKDEINALKIQMLQNQISEYKKQMKEAEDSYVEMQKDQARRMESIYRNKDMMEETYLKRIKEVKTEAEKKAIEEEFNSMLEEFGEGMTLDDYLKMLGIDSLEEFIVMDLKSDGTVDMAVAGEDPVSGTWKQDGDKITLTVDGETSELTRNGNELECKMDDQDYVFIKK